MTLFIQMCVRLCRRLQYVNHYWRKTLKYNQKPFQWKLFTSHIAHHSRLSGSISSFWNLKSKPKNSINYFKLLIHYTDNLVFSSRNNAADLKSDSFDVSLTTVSTLFWFLLNVFGFRACFIWLKWKNRWTEQKGQQISTHNGNGIFKVQCTNTNINRCSWFPWHSYDFQSFPFIKFTCVRVHPTFNDYYHRTWILYGTLGIRHMAHMYMV